MLPETSSPSEVLPVVKESTSTHKFYRFLVNLLACSGSIERTGKLEAEFNVE